MYTLIIIATILSGSRDGGASVAINKVEFATQTQCESSIEEVTSMANNRYLRIEAKCLKTGGK